MTYKLSDKLEANLRIGKHCIIKKDDLYRIISPFKDTAGDYRETGLYYSPEVACKFIGESHGCPLTEYDDDFKWVGTYTPEYERLAIGQKVKLGDKEVWKIEDSDLHLVLRRLSDGFYTRVNPNSIKEVLVEGEDEKEKTIRQPKQITRAEIARELGIEGEFEIID